MEASPWGAGHAREREAAVGVHLEDRDLVAPCVRPRGANGRLSVRVTAPWLASLDPVPLPWVEYVPSRATTPVGPVWYCKTEFEGSVSSIGRLRRSLPTGRRQQREGPLRRPTREVRPVNRFHAFPKSVGIVLDGFLKLLQIGSKRCGTFEQAGGAGARYVWAFDRLGLDCYLQEGTGRRTRGRIWPRGTGRPHSEEGDMTEYE